MNIPFKTLPLLLALPLCVFSMCGCSGNDFPVRNCNMGDEQVCHCSGEGGTGIQYCVSLGGGDYAWGKCLECSGAGDGGTQADGGPVDSCQLKGVTGKPCSTPADCTGLSNPYCLSNMVCPLIAEYAPNCDIPGGYCTMYTQVMTETLNCGTGGIEFNGTRLDPRAAAKACLKCCRNDADCRSGEGYYCSRTVGGCLPAFTKPLLP
jgi:hypothetical protein